MKNRNKITIIACLIVWLSSATPGLAQQKNHEFAAYIAGGISALDYKTTIGKQTNLFGGNFGIGYTYFFNDNWGVVSGLEATLYKSKMEFDRVQTKYMTKDFLDDEFEFRSTMNNYKEDQKAIMLTIPIMAQYQTGGNTKFFTNFGMKIALPISAKYKTTMDNITNTGYFEYEHVEYVDQEFMGFGTFSDRAKTDKLKLNTAVLVALEAGIKWKWDTEVKNWVYTAIFCDYGLNNINKKQNLNFVQYNPKNPIEFSTNSILNAKYSNENQQNINFTENVKPIAVGIKIKVTF